MRNFMLASVIMLGLAACGSGQAGQKQALVDACLADGDGDAAQCSCIAEKSIETLDPKLIDIMVEATQADDSDAYMMSKMGELSPEDLQSLMQLAMTASSECNIDFGQ